MVGGFAHLCPIVMTATAVAGNASVVEARWRPGHRRVAYATILSRGKVIYRLSFFLHVVVTALAIAGDTRVIKTGWQPGKSTVTTITFGCSENVLGRFSRCNHLVVAAGTGLCNGIMIERCGRPGQA